MKKIKIDWTGNENDVEAAKMRHHTYVVSSSIEIVSIDFTISFCFNFSSFLYVFFYHFLCVSIIFDFVVWMKES